MIFSQLLSDLAIPVKPDLSVVLALIILFLPLFSFTLLYFFGRFLPGKGDFLATGAMAISFLLAALLCMEEFGEKPHYARILWFKTGSGIQTVHFTISIIVNSVTSLLLVLVTLISFLVHLYSIEYMEGKRNYLRYFPYLALFTFSMLGIILSDNLLVTFFFWELVGFSSYLLIGFWFEKDSAAKAAKKAFIVNRVGDAGFLLGIMILYTEFGTLELSVISESIMGLQPLPFWVMIAGLGLFCASVGKSAQFPLMIWLPDAMEGPTPVSALIHAATMVAAGVFLLYKSFFLLSPEILIVIAIIGAITSIMAAYSAITQFDIKKVLAFSTISQLGYMMIGIGVGSYDVALFHLFTHAFFKACLFLCAGTVIHEMHHIHKHLFNEGNYIEFNNLDMRLMGGFRHKIPVTFYTYLISSLSLIGLPLFSGFLSKDAILIRAMDWAEQSGNLLYFAIPIAGFITVFLTAFYMGRQLFLVFFNKFRLGELHETAERIFNHLNEVSWRMNIPKITLAIFSFWIFFSINPFHADHSWFLNEISSGHAVKNNLYHWLIPSITLALAFTGLGLSWKLYRNSTTIGIGRFTESTLFNISYHNFYLDKIFKKYIGNSAVAIGNSMQNFDRRVIDWLINSFGIANVVVAHLIAWMDRYVVDGLVTLSVFLSGVVGKVSRKLQHGNIQGYLIIVGLSFLILLGIILF